ncbi:MAG: MFS transporter [Planctomycetaceae bacterium]|nr:MFS transporter [Planctomycetaceae bacterium]
MEPSPHRPDDPYAALRYPDYRRYLVGNLISVFGMQLQMTAIAHEIYSRTGSNYSVAQVALVQFIPVLLFSLPAGQLADTLSRKRIVQVAMGVATLGSFGLALLSFYGGPIQWMYLCLFMNGTAKAIQQPAKSSLMPLIVPKSLFSNAVTWNSGGFQLTSIAGPAVAGALIGLGCKYSFIYALEGVATFVFLLLLATVKITEPERQGWTDPWVSFKQGIRFLTRQNLLLSALSLDLFAVLLGGAVMLLPVYQKILHVGDYEYGLMRSAPAFGALLMSFFLARHGGLQRAGRTLLWSVVAFGIFTIIFGFSRSFPLSLLMLTLLGAVDMISVVIRHTLVQLLTPDHMRGRVQAVNGLFITASNELGGFESGAVAALFDRPQDPAFGPTISVVSGGIGTLIVVAIVAYASPQLRKYDRLGDGTSSD